MGSEQRVALITGGARGIGAGIVRRLTDDGIRVAFTYLTAKERADELAEQTGALAIHADSGEVEAVQASVAQTVRELGGLDILVNNSFAGGILPVEEFPLDLFDRMLAVNLRGAWVAIQAAVPHMTKAGRIINIGSIFADHTPVAGNLEAGEAIYAMTKAGLAGMARGLARELGPRDITVNTIQPGVIASDSAKAYPGAIDYMVSQTPVGKVGQPADVASVVSYLAGLESWFVTGATWDIDGGFAV